MLLIVQALLEFSQGVGLDLGQTGYQAMAAGCISEEAGLILLDKMKVWHGMDGDYSILKQACVFNSFVLVNDWVGRRDKSRWEDGSQSDSISYRDCPIPG